ncbi:MAG: ribonuclease P protein component [Anaerolineae bacterium]|nr:ribonuclease P protein component [Anaerolineae bacterium]
MQRRLRLRHTRDFQRLRQQGQVNRHPTMVFSFALNDLDHNRYGFITPKRLGNAVKRNRIRRQVREAVRLLHPRLKQGYDIVIIVRFPLMGQPFHKIQRIVSELCDRAGLVLKEF